MTASSVSKIRLRKVLIQRVKKQYDFSRKGDISMDYNSNTLVRSWEGCVDAQDNTVFLPQQHPNVLTQLCNEIIYRLASNFFNQQSM
jgi:hypothetical protein